MQYIWAMLIGYLIGSISFSFLMAKWLKGIDIRKHGSGNAGATNTLRVLGYGPAIAVLLLDVGKGIVVVLLGRWLGGDNLWIPVIAGTCVIIGHNWPVYFGFKGGKGVASTIGVMATLCFLPALFAGIIAILSIALTRYVSLGSLIFTTLMPFAIVIMKLPAEILWASLFVWVLSFIRHRANIVKLASGKEHKLGSKV